MFPIPWNKAFRKKDGTLVNMEDMGGGGGGSDIPEHSVADAGKVLGVDENGDLAWVEVSSGNITISNTAITGIPTTNVEEVTV